MQSEGKECQVTLLQHLTLCGGAAGSQMLVPAWSHAMVDAFTGWCPTKLLTTFRADLFGT